MNQNVQNSVDFFFVDFRAQARFGAFGATKLKWNHVDNYTLSTCTEIFSFVALIVLEEKSGQQDPLKLKIRDFAKPEVTSSK